MELLHEFPNLNNYVLLRRDRNRNVGGIAYAILEVLCYAQKQNFPYKIENIFFKLRVPKSKPVAVGFI